MGFRPREVDDGPLRTDDDDAWTNFGPVPLDRATDMSRHSKQAAMKGVIVNVLIAFADAMVPK